MHKRRDFIVLIAVFGLVWFGSSLPPSRLPRLMLFNWDKLLHLAEYTVVGLALLRALRHVIQRRSTLFPTVLILGALWAASDEIHQSFTGRSCSLMDGVADMLGILLSLLLWQLWGTRHSPVALEGKSRPDPNTTHDP